MTLYEAMILLDNNFVRENWDSAVSALADVITKHGGKVENTVKWDERKLAYEIKKQKRGTYVLMHFNAPTSAVVGIERDYKLLESVLRVLITVDVDGVDVPEPTEATNVIASY